MKIFTIALIGCLACAAFPAGAVEMPLVPKPQSVQATGGSFPVEPVVRSRDASLQKEGCRLGREGVLEPCRRGMEYA